MSDYLILYLVLGLVFALLNIDYRARFGVRGIPVLLVTILIWPLLLILRLLVIGKRLLYPQS